MTKKLATLGAALAVAAPLALPALASATAPSAVARSYSVQIHNRGRVAGIRIVGTRVRCASDGGGNYECFGTYTALISGRHYTYGSYIKDSPRGWHTIGTARLVREW
jgi:hypothetical protein